MAGTSLKKQDKTLKKKKKKKKKKKTTTKTKNKWGSFGFEFKQGYLCLEL